MPFVPRVRHKTGVYQIRNLIDGKIYIGSAASSFAQRWSGHLSRLRKGRHRNKHLQRAWIKYGEDNFVFEVLECCTPEQATCFEQVWIDVSGACNQRFGYNLNPTAGNMLGHKHTEEAKAKISSAGIGRRHTEDAKAKIAAASKGRKQTEETLKKYKERRQTPEAKAKISDAAKRQWEDEDHRLNVSNKNREANKEQFSDSVKRERHRLAVIRQQEANGTAALTEDIVREARQLKKLNPRFWTYKRLCERYNCGFITIYKAVVGRTWSHVI